MAAIPDYLRAGGCSHDAQKHQHQGRPPFDALYNLDHIATLRNAMPRQLFVSETQSEKAFLSLTRQ